MWALGTVPTVSYGCQHWQRSWSFMLLQFLTLLNGCPDSLVLWVLGQGKSSKNCSCWLVEVKVNLRNQGIHKNRKKDPKGFQHYPLNILSYFGLFTFPYKIRTSLLCFTNSCGCFNWKCLNSIDQFGEEPSLKY